GLPATGTARRHAGTDRTSTSPARPVRPVISRLDDVLTRSGTWWQARRAWQAQRKRRRSLKERSQRFRTFWVSNPFERDNIVGAVVFEDEYELGADPFLPGDVIVDVGAHIGAFSYWCYLKGSRAIYCYEPLERNFQILERNLAGKSVERHRVAVWRSDRR